MEKKKQPLKKKQPAREKAIKPEAVALKPSQTKAAEGAAAVFPVVGIGASAGGLAAFEKFFAGMPAKGDIGMAFVLVQHLAPDHKSILGDLIKRYTRMQVFEVKDGINVQPNCAYIIPPNRDMAFLHGSLFLSEPLAPRGLRLPIDFFFRSLAQDQHERAVCIVLSGTGSDGTLGMRAIKGEGGMAMAQTPESTEYDGMPLSAIATGLVDYVLPPGDMPAQLMAYTKHVFGRKTLPSVSPNFKSTDLLKKIYILLRAHTGHDFSFYKQNTIVRRIERRMAVNQIVQMEDYLRYLQQSPPEVKALFKDLLIGVTSFFRDQEAFKIVNKMVIPHLFDGLGRGGSVRAWVPGCSTGEEAYSMAILLQEYMEAHKQDFKVQIFATDIDGQAIQRARSGIYPSNIAADVSQERLARYFTMSEDGGTYHVQKFIRDMLIFSEQDVIVDPPFSRLGLISCRNLLIYMGTELQKKVLSLFNYALNKDGFLFLGSSESIGEFSDAFGVLDRKWKLYQHKGIAYLPQAISGVGPLLRADARPPHIASSKESIAGIGLLTERELLQQYAPVSAVITERGETVYIHGSSGKYLEPAVGEASANIMRMAREGLRRELTTAIRRAATKKVTVRYPGLVVKSEGTSTVANLTVRPFAERPDLPQGLLLVTFEEVPSKARVKRGTRVAPVAADQQDEKIKILERELQDKEEYLQTTFEELETANEELKSTNEELQSANEELGSTNEELETSREELQSMNEELSTVNYELLGKVDQLSQTGNYLHNLLAATGVGTIFVDNQMNITFFTPAVTSVIHLIASDIGRPVGHIASSLVGYDSLAQDIRAVLHSLVPREIEVTNEAGLWYLLRIMPFRTLENTIDGAVITFTDITERKRITGVENEVNILKRMATLFKDPECAMVVQDLRGRIMAWNPGAVKLYGWSEDEALALNIRDRVPGGEAEKDLDMLQKITVSNKIETFKTRRLTSDGRVLDVCLTATSLLNDDGKLYAISTTEQPIN